MLLIQEAPHGRLSHLAPTLNPFKQGDYTDLGLENLGLGKRYTWQLRKALTLHGAQIPGLPLRIRITPENLIAIEPSDGTEEAILPNNWQQGVLTVITATNTITWLGKLVAPAHIPPNLDKTKYHQTDDGLLLK